MSERSGTGLSAEGDDDVSFPSTNVTSGGKRSDEENRGGDVLLKVACVALLIVIAAQTWWLLQSRLKPGAEQTSADSASSSALAPSPFPAGGAGSAAGPSMPPLGRVPGGAPEREGFGGGGPEFFLPVDELGAFIHHIVALNETAAPLTEEQRAKMRPIAEGMVAAAARMQSDLEKAVATLTTAQLSSLGAPHMEIMQALLQSAPTSQEGDPILSGTLLELRKAAARTEPSGAMSAASPAVVAGAPSMPLNRQFVCVGLLYLMRQKELSLSPVQAKTCLESLEDYSQQLQELATGQEKLLAVLSSEQMKSLTAKRVTSAEQAAARYLLYALDAPRK